MKYLICVGILSTVCFSTSIVFPQSQTVNSISGFVLDANSRSPVSDVYVELMDDVYMTLKRMKTDASGRYFFSGISSGTFKVKVLPYGTNYLEEIQDVTIINSRIGSTVTSDNVYLDMYLKLDRRKISLVEITPSGVVFVQNVPASAKSLYKKGISQLEKAKEFDAGLENLKKAIEMFPDYYDALDRLGLELVRRKQYFDSLPFLVRSVTVNPRSYSSFYVLGLAAYNLKQMKEAAEAFRTATILNPESTQAHLQYGMVLRIKGNYKEAEKSLLKAKSLTKDLTPGVIHWQLALLYEKLERFSEAAEELEKYLKAQPDIENTQQVKELIARFRAKTTK